MATRAATLRQGLNKGRDPAEELLSLRRLLYRVRLDAIVVVKRARKAGMTWRQIGDALDMTESGARRKYREADYQ